MITWQYGWWICWVPAASSVASCVLLVQLAPPGTVACLPPQGGGRTGGRSSTFLKCLRSGSAHPFSSYQNFPVSRFSTRGAGSTLPATLPSCWAPPRVEVLHYFRLTSRGLSCWDGPPFLPPSDLGSGDLCHCGHFHCPAVLVGAAKLFLGEVLRIFFF